MNHNELITRREELEQELMELHSEVILASRQGEDTEILRDSYNAALSRLETINRKLGQ